MSRQTGSAAVFITRKSGSVFNTALFSPPPIQIAAQSSPRKVGLLCPDRNLHKPAKHLGEIPPGGGAPRDTRGALPPAPYVRAVRYDFATRPITGLLLARKRLTIVALRVWGVGVFLGFIVIRRMGKEVEEQLR